MELHGQFCAECGEHFNTYDYLESKCSLCRKPKAIDNNDIIKQLEDLLIISDDSEIEELRNYLKLLVGRKEKGTSASGLHIANVVGSAMKLRWIETENYIPQTDSFEKILQQTCIDDKGGMYWVDVPIVNE